MGKRKRDPVENEDGKPQRGTQLVEKENTELRQKPQTKTEGGESKVTVQVVTGSYERALHGIVAEVDVEGAGEVQFSDTFLFNAHASAIRYLAISPEWKDKGGEGEKVMLASGGTDERINLYHLSTQAPTAKSKSRKALGGVKGAVENSKNRELGSLLHHGSSITKLVFPTRSKLLSGSEDNTIAISRTRDWTVLSTIKAPAPHVQGRPSGDTAPLGGAPVGVNDFAVHPSMRLMISVGKGEKCMRLWNLVTGKKAGVLTFDRHMLQSVAEGRFSGGEGRRVEWNPDGNEFVVAFERGALIFGMDCKPRARIVPSPRTKLHGIHYVELQAGHSAIAVSTEDGRVVFYSSETEETTANGEDSISILQRKMLGQFGAELPGRRSRIKDFQIFPLRDFEGVQASQRHLCLIVTASSDGAVRIWRLDPTNLPSQEKTDSIARLLGTYDTGRRITCLAGLLMRPTEPKREESEFEDSASSSDG